MGRKIELLAPARNLECGMAAIEHGADAVYIGAERFGARAAAGNSPEDIKALCDYAHKFGAKVYVTVNTIVYDKELEDTMKLLERLGEIGVDAVLVQDMGLVRLAGNRLASFGVELHASTQTDNRTADKVKWLRDLGFTRVVLARELSLDEIGDIHREVPDVELEVFVHGALCVSYSGVCYASQYCFGRSANRGECAQFCRLKFDLEDAGGNVIERGRHLLSLKDMNRLDSLEQLLDAGVTSLKIEGRLKDIEYVKNVTAAYSERLNMIIGNSNGRYARASSGKCRYAFEPNLKKTFNRGFTDYFLNGRRPDIASFDTPKAIGEYVGKVKDVRGGALIVAGTSVFANGDGLCFVNDRRELEGFRVNKVVNNKLFPLKIPEGLRPGMALYRNSDHDFEKMLAGKSSERKITADMLLEETPGGYRLKLSVPENGRYAVAEIAVEKQVAMKPQIDNIKRQLAKLGNTVYDCGTISFSPENFNYFIPSSMLADLRRKAVEELDRVNAAERMTGRNIAVNNGSVAGYIEHGEYGKHTYSYNISNSEARLFYAGHGMRHIADAFELKPVKDALVMQCRHCLRYTLGYCVKRGGKRPAWREPLRLVLADGRRFMLRFDCSECQMNVYAEN